MGFFYYYAISLTLILSLKKSCVVRFALLNQMTYVQPKHKIVFFFFLHSQHYFLRRCSN